MCERALIFRAIFFAVVRDPKHDPLRYDVFVVVENLAGKNSSK